MAPTRIAGIEYAAMPKAGTKASTLAWPPKLVVIHDTGNNGSTRYNEASYASTRTDAQSRWTSAHCYTDPGGVLGSLPLTLQAWAAYSYANSHGFHIEMCRTAAGVDPRTVANTTPVVRWLCQQAGIPLRKLSPADVAAGKSGICGHRDITLGLGVGDHEDPGANFDWATFMAQVTGGDDMGAKQDAEVSNANRYGWAIVAGLPKIDGIYNPDALAAGTTTVTNWTVATLQQLAAAAAENKVRDTALAAAVQALAVGSGIDVDGLMAHVEAAVQAAVQPLQAQLAAADARAEKLAAALAAAGGALEAADS